MLGTREYYELIEQFDKQHRGVRLDKEDKTFWEKGYVYQDGHVNEKFMCFLKGYALGKAVGRDAEALRVDISVLSVSNADQHKDGGANV